MSEPLIFEERIRAVRHRLMLIHAATGASDDALGINPEDVRDAVFAITLEALDLLDPIREHMPGEWSSWIPPAKKKKGGAR